MFGNRGDAKDGLRSVGDVMIEIGHAVALDENRLTIFESGDGAAGMIRRDDGVEDLINALLGGRTLIDLDGLAGTTG